MQYQSFEGCGGSPLLYNISNPVSRQGQKGGSFDAKIGCFCYNGIILRPFNTQLPQFLRSFGTICNFYIQYVAATYRIVMWRVCF